MTGKPKKDQPEHPKSNTSGAAKPSAATAPSKVAGKQPTGTKPAAPEAKPALKKTEESGKPAPAAPETSAAPSKVSGKNEASKSPKAPEKPAVVEAAIVSKPADAAPKAGGLPLNVNLAFVIDDEPANRDFLERLINQAEYETVGASSGKEAIEVAGKLPSAPAIIAVDSELPDIKGIELIKQFRTQFPQSKIVMATMHDDLNTINEAFKHGCDVFLVKPHGFMELFKRLKSVKTDPSVLDKLVFDSHGVRQRREPKA